MKSEICDTDQVHTVREPTTCSAKNEIESTHYTLRRQRTTCSNCNITRNANYCGRTTGRGNNTAQHGGIRAGSMENETISPTAVNWDRRKKRKWKCPTEEEISLSWHKVSYDSSIYREL